MIFLGIENIHGMRDSLSRLRQFLDTHGASSSDGSSSILVCISFLIASRAVCAGHLGDLWYSQIGFLWNGSMIQIPRSSPCTGALKMCCFPWSDRIQFLSSSTFLLLSGFSNLFEVLSGFDSPYLVNCLHI